MCDQKYKTCPLVGQFADSDNDVITKLLNMSVISFLPWLAQPIPSDGSDELKVKIEKFVSINLQYRRKRSRELCEVWRELAVQFTLDFESYSR